TDSEVVRLLAISSPLASPLSPWSSPPSQIPFPPLPLILSPLSPILSLAPPPSPIRESSFAAAARLAGGFRADYGFVAMVDKEIMRDPERETERQLLAGRLNMLVRDRRAHAYTRQLMETEARMSREAWVRATDASDLVHGEVMSLRTTVLGQMPEIRELQGLAGDPIQSELPEEAGGSA
nr:hypothetical protein [Tanacetum cinerariifolium]GFC43556.1 hypothetical protein [Tanacetum cinerariifolium]